MNKKIILFIIVSFNMDSFCYSMQKYKNEKTLELMNLFVDVTLHPQDWRWDYKKKLTHEENKKHVEFVERCKELNKQVDMLLVAGADPNAYKNFDEEASEPIEQIYDGVKSLLWIVCQMQDSLASGIAAILVMHGASLEAQDEWSDTPLHYAVLNGSPSLYQILTGYCFWSDMSKAEKLQAMCYHFSSFKYVCQTFCMLIKRVEKATKKKFPNPLKYEILLKNFDNSASHDLLRSIYDYAVREKKLVGIRTEYAKKFWV